MVFLRIDLFTYFSETLPVASGTRRPREQSSLSESAVRPANSPMPRSHSSCPHQALHVLHRLVDPKIQPVLLMDAGAGHRVGAVVGCLRKLQSWCVSAILDEYRRYAGDRARDSVEHFMELFDTDLVHVSVRPQWLCVGAAMMRCLVAGFHVIAVQVRII